MNDPAGDTSVELAAEAREEPPELALVAPQPSGSSVAVSGTIVVYGALPRWARRVAACVALLSPFLSKIPVGPCLLAAFLYGHVGQAARKRGRFVADRSGLRIARADCPDELGPVLLPRAGYAFAFPSGESDVFASLCFVERGAIVAELTLDSAADRAAVIDALGFDQDPSVIRIHGALFPEVRAAIGVLLVLVGLAVFGYAARVESLAAMVVGLVAIVVAVAPILRRDLRVGHDGISIAAPFRRWWVSFDELRGVSKVGWWLRLHTARGDVDVTPPLLWPGRRAAAARDWMVVLLRRSVARYAALPRSAAYGLRKGARDLPTEGAFRELPVTNADLLDILQNPRCTPQQRVRAAAALLEAARTPEHVGHVTMAAQRSASPTLERALEELVAEWRSRRRDVNPS